MGVAWWGTGSEEGACPEVPGAARGGVGDESRRRAGPRRGPAGPQRFGLGASWWCFEREGAAVWTAF